jgi:hypothetical protein
MRDPRSHRRYRTAAKAYIAAHPGATCCLCDDPIDTTLPSTMPWGPTIEHLVPIRDIIASARDDMQALAAACDTSSWGIAHRRCQDQQGASVTNGRIEPTQAVVYVPSIDW